MADYTAEQVEALAEFARRCHANWTWSMGANTLSLPNADQLAAEKLGLLDADGTLADWLRPEDWAMRAVRDVEAELNESFSADLHDRVAAIIRRHAEDRT